MMKKLLILLLSALSVAIFAQEKQVAILEPIAMTKEVSTMHRSMVRGEMVKAISRQSGYAAFTRTDIDQIMSEQNFQQSGMVDDATRKRIGAMQGVDYVCVTKITKEGNNYYLEANLVDIETGKISNPATQYGELEGGSLSNMLAACEKLAAELVGAQSVVYNATISTYSYASSTASQTYLEQQCSKGLDYYEAENYIEAIKIWKPLAEQGYAEAQSRLGICYDTGTGVAQDYYAAVSWFKKAAEQGHAEAQFYLGGRYYTGEGVSKDDYAAVSWFKKAAEQGHAGAQFCLGACYSNGAGVSEDDYAAVSWFKKAAEQGYADAQYVLGMCYYNGEGVSKDDYAAVSWFKKAAEQGYADAQYALGVCYYNGEGVSKDDYAAVSWLRKAAVQGNESAKEALERL